MSKDVMNRKTNRLADQSSPYLLQHSSNPVDWFPWGADAFERAKVEDRPIFVSIGYSTCHWCHVMAHESFEDREIAGILNESYVSVKVDKEERPDIDHFFMNACQRMTGAGGWPLTAIMTPGSRLFFIGTYIPKRDRYGRPGLLTLLEKIAYLWKNDRTLVTASAEKIFNMMNEDEPLSGSLLNEAHVESAFRKLYERFDDTYGGFGSSLKFPMPDNLLFLLRYWKRTGDEEALRMVEYTLINMRNGGIYDQLGFGFHRYATDIKWRVPHFEKMLYDQALISIAYLEGFQATKNEIFARTAREIFQYVAEELTSPEGAFYTAQDADSGGEEGRFYQWTCDEIYEALGPEDGKIALKIFNIRPEGNFINEFMEKEKGKNILYINERLAQTAVELDLSWPDFLNKFEDIRLKLHRQRKKRGHLHKDTKILTDWNSLMTASLARGAKVLGEKKYLEMAEKSLNHILKHMINEKGILLHALGNKDSIGGNLDDYAFLVFALIELYEATFNPEYLIRALDFNEKTMELFEDRENGGFYFTLDSMEPVLKRQKIFQGGSIPSGNAVQMYNLVKLSFFTGNGDLREKAEKIGMAFSGEIQRLAWAHAFFMISADLLLNPVLHLVIAAEPNDAEVGKMNEVLGGLYLPDLTTVFRPINEDAYELLFRVKTLENFVAVGNKATAYLCRNFICSHPVSTADELMEQLTGKNKE